MEGGTQSRGGGREWEWRRDGKLQFNNKTIQASNLTASSPVGIIL